MSLIPPIMMPDNVDNKDMSQVMPKLKLVEIGNSVDSDEVAHNEPPHLDLHCLPSNIWKLSIIL